MDIDILKNKRKSNQTMDRKKDLKNNKIQTTIQKLKKKSKLNNTISGFLFITYNILTFMEVFFFIGQNISKNINYKSEQINTILRIIAISITFPNFFLIYNYYKIRLKIEKTLKLRTKKDNLRSSGFLKFLLIEYFIIIIITPPYFDYSFRFKQLGLSYILVFDSIFFFIGLFRSYLYFRLYQQYSRWTNESSSLICKKNKCRPTLLYVIKCELNYRPYIMIISLITITILLFGFALRNFE